MTKKIQGLEAYMGQELQFIPIHLNHYADSISRIVRIQ